MARHERLTMRVRQFRDAQGLTQEQLAEKSGLSRAYIGRLEIGRHDPALSTLERLARALKVKVGKLLE
ncbi:MAG TPA: helix-turn-helix transcriptional regulator [Candidatus Sulfotelmatobacter sp.]|nr:helix-turn-helix transcriptional regulator [Candidatus Sulfotelmatobacter sp.]